VPRLHGVVHREAIPADVALGQYPEIPDIPDLPTEPLPSPFVPTASA
jgi:hypothetical protein